MVYREPIDVDPKQGDASRPKLTIELLQHGSFTLAVRSPGRQELDDDGLTGVGSEG